MFGADFDQLGPSAQTTSEPDAGSEAVRDATTGQEAAAPTPPPPCPADAALCDDFERSPLDVKGAWSSLEVAEGSTLELAPVFGLGLGLHAVMSAQVKYGQIQRNVALGYDSNDRSASRVRVGTQLAFDEYPTQGVRILELRLGEGSVRIVAHSDGRLEAVGDQSSYFSTSPQKGLRHRLEVLLQWRDGQQDGTYEVYLSDAARAGRTKVAAGTVHTARAGRVVVSLGLEIPTEPKAWDLFFDDTVVLLDDSVDSARGI